MYIGSGTSRNTITFIVVVCSILCVCFMLFSTAYLSFYLGVCNTNFIEKNCTNEGVASKLGINSSDLHNVIEEWMKGLKKGISPSVNVTMNGESVDFFSDQDKQNITEISKKIILMKRLAYTFLGVSFALIMVVLIEGRAVILRNTIAIVGALLLLGGGGLILFMQMNPERFRDGFFTDVILRGRPLEGWLSQVISQGMLKSAFIMVISLFLIVQLLFLIIISGFTGTKKSSRKGSRR
ncbi:MAG: hypothetical protein K5877_06410 [Lachnospiraceae bacterium]|nr:hypothetical protein [Lachnospiraceae bacterium]